MTNSVVDPGSTETPQPLKTGEALPERRGVDYSKFDSIVDSDDEKPVAPKGESKESKPAEKPHCWNCHEDCLKPLLCGRCKKAMYCCQKCQKDDWQYHKRTCKVPEPPKKSEEAKQAPPRPKPEARKKEEKVVDNDNEENLTWYRHREWKPTSEPKQEFKPTKIATEAAEVEPDKPQRAGSVWNAAGTWEEKDVTAMAQTSLSSKLSSTSHLEAVGGVFSVQEVSDVTGDASKPVVRGKLRHLFDLSFKVKFSFKWTESDGQKSASGTIEISDFTNDTTFGEEGSEPQLKLTFRNTKLDTARHKAVEAAIAVKQWPPPAGSFMAAIASRMQSWAAEYKQEE
mmetsp:Transcript_18177/g.42272  ORF Transcript_18177/g.42272 Transcript_18177/m.42272 type:complete len:341 (-) Transcript_18177:88-1110(-)